jgi:hypothetical protein
MKSHRLLYSAVFAALACGHALLAASTPALSRAEFNVVVRAIDDQGHPVPQADVGFSWGAIDGPKPDSGSERQIAGADGWAVFSGATFLSRYAYGARKEGFYPVYGVLANFAGPINNRWQPWAQVIDVTLKPVKNPVPMFARMVTGELPAANGWIGYDLEQGDWVAPHGKGAQADLEFHVDAKIEDNSNYDGTLTVRFPGEGNGIMVHEIDPADGSELKMPYAAPVEGYVTTLTLRHARLLGAGPGGRDVLVDETNPHRGYIFRVRATVGAEHQVTKAIYGKIHGPFVFDPRSEHRNGFVSFLYYLNPDGTRNLEFDPKRNLFPDQRVPNP